MGDEPDNPFTVLQEGAIRTHELYSAYVTAGFTPDQALKIVIGILQASLRG